MEEMASGKLKKFAGVMFGIIVLLGYLIGLEVLLFNAFVQLGEPDQVRREVQVADTGTDRGHLRSDLGVLRL